MSDIYSQELADVIELERMRRARRPGSGVVVALHPPEPANLSDLLHTEAARHVRRRRPYGRCCYCGARAHGAACRAHTDLLALDPERCGG